MFYGSAAAGAGLLGASAGLSTSVIYDEVVSSDERQPGFRRLGSIPPTDPKEGIKPK